MEHKEQKNEIVIYTGDGGQPRINVRVESETVWLSQAKIAELFDVTPQNITTHLKNIYLEGELEEIRTCKESLQVQEEGGREVNRTVSSQSSRLSVFRLGGNQSSRTHIDAHGRLGC